MSKQSVEDLLERAIEQHRGGALEEAKRLYRSVLQSHPEQPDALRYLGLASLQGGAFAEAAESFQHAIDLGVGGADVHNFLGRAFLELGQAAKALPAFRNALELQPDFAQAQNNLGLAHEDLGDHAKAAQAFERAYTLDDTFADAINNLGNSMQALARHDDALLAYRRAANLNPRSAEVHANIGDMLKQLGDLPGSIASYQHALSFQSDNALIHYRLAEAQFQQNRARDSLDTLDRCLRHDEACQLALALKSAILHDLGNTDEAHELLDYERFIKVVSLSPPEPYPTITAFNQDLGQYVLQHESLIYNPAGASTRGGQHSADLLIDAQGPALGLKSMLRSAIGDFVTQLPIDPRHPFLAQTPDQMRVVAQANILDSSGFLSPHVHPAAWVSGAYYVCIPDSVGGEDAAGCIEFGVMPDDIQLRSKPRTHRIRPVEGMLVLFPSYFYHGTLPFESKTCRMSIGVDVISTRQ